MFVSFGGIMLMLLVFGGVDMIEDGCCGMFMFGILLQFEKLGFVLGEVGDGKYLYEDF